jgi:hypothetical protein
MNVRKVLLTILFLLGLTLALAGISAWVFPDWLNLPGGWLLLLGAAFIAIAGLGGKIKDWVELLFGEEEKARARDKSKPTVPSTSGRSQEMQRSESSKQIMRGRGGRQEQKMSDSPNSEQRME